MRSVDFNGPGLPEIFLFKPLANGNHALTISAVDGTAGFYKLYLFNNSSTTSPHIGAVNSFTLSGGESKEFVVTSNGGKPVAVFANPLSDDINVISKIKIGEAVIIEANFGGLGSHESAYVLPNTTTTYTIEIDETADRNGSVELLILTFADRLEE